MTTSSIEIHASMSSIADEWDELADRTQASPFVRPGWFGAWWRAFGVGELEILAVRQHGLVRAVLPLTARRGVHEAPANAHSVDVPLLVENDHAVCGARRAAWHGVRSGG